MRRAITSSAPRPRVRKIISDKNSALQIIEVFPDDCEVKISLQLVDTVSS